MDDSGFVTAEGEEGQKAVNTPSYSRLGRELVISKMVTWLVQLVWTHGIFLDKQFGKTPFERFDRHLTPLEVTLSL